MGMELADVNDLNLFYAEKERFFEVLAKSVKGEGSTSVMNYHMSFWAGKKERVAKDE